MKDMEQESTREGEQDVRQEEHEVTAQSDAPETPEERIFTQGEVNEIVQKRLARERERHTAMLNGDEFGNELAQREQAVLARELKMEAKERLQKAGLPTAAARLLHYDSEQVFEESLAAAIEVLGPMKRDAVEERFRASGRSPHKSNPAVASGGDPLRDAFRANR